MKLNDPALMHLSPAEREAAQQVLVSIWWEERGATIDQLVRRWAVDVRRSRKALSASNHKILRRQIATAAGVTMHDVQVRTATQKKLDVTVHLDGLTRTAICAVHFTGIIEWA